VNLNKEHINGGQQKVESSVMKAFASDKNSLENLRVFSVSCVKV